MKALNTSVKVVKNVTRYIFGKGAIQDLDKIISDKKKSSSDYVIYFIDSFFKDISELRIELRKNDEIFFTKENCELSTADINETINYLREVNKVAPCCVVGIGGGSTMDSAKAVGNMLTNPGQAEDYQGWDLVKKPAPFKIGVPTLSGTGAEATRTCVMTNSKSGLKLGMNSDYTVYDFLILDPDLTKTVPKIQYFYSGMDTYIHCIESLRGGYRNAVGDALSRQALSLCRDVFTSSDMMSDASREALMVASYLGGSAVATSYVGVVHPLSAGLSVVLKIPHCQANCIAMRAVEEFYPEDYTEFWQMVDRQNISVPKGVCLGLSGDEYKLLYDAMIIHEKPLTNALGEKYRLELDFDRVVSLYQKM